MSEATATERRASDLLIAVKNANPDSSVDELIEARVREVIGKGSVGQQPAFMRGGLVVQRQNSLADRFPYGAVLASIAAAYTATDKNGRLRDFHGKPGEYAARNFGEDSVAFRALNSGTMEDGGIFVEPEFRDDLMIDILVATTAVLKAGPVVVPMGRGAVEIPRVTGDVEAAYRGELQPPVISQPTFGKEALRSRIVDTFVAISNDLLARGGAKVAQLCESILRRRLSVVVDQALITGSGSDFTPKGLRNHALTATPATNSTTPTFAQVLADLGKQITRLAESDVNVTKGTFILAPRVGGYLAYQAVTDLGVPYFLEMIAKGNLLGFPMFQTNNVATNLGGGANESYVLFSDFDRVFFGQESEMALRVSTEATYVEGGVTKSAFQRDETLMAVTDKHDLQVEHPEAVDVMSAVKWGG